MKLEALHKQFLLSNGICTDSRKLIKGQIFFALKGPSFNGNQYAKKVIEKGARYAVVDDLNIEGDAVILVKNALKTLQDLACFHRNYLGIPIIALTGSNGKTTTKELINVVLLGKYKTKATLGNLNNHIGVPLTLLAMNKSTEIGVVEMGANHLKEIEQLCAIAQPNYGFITNIGKAHLEGFGSEKNILIAKTELYQYLKKSKGIIFCFLEDTQLAFEARGGKTVFFSKREPSSYIIDNKNTPHFVSVTYKDHLISSQLIGDYNYTNIAAAIAIGLFFEVSIEKIKEAIEKYIPSDNRSQLINTDTNKLILDAYNANPTSMMAAINNFEKNPSLTTTKIIILGDMFELGEYEEAEHQFLLDYVSGVECFTKIFLVGESFSKSKVSKSHVSVFENTSDLIAHLVSSPILNSFILIKGSRGMALESLVKYV